LYGSSAGSRFTSVISLLEDAEGNIWAGCKSGLMRTPGDYLEYIEAFSPEKNTNVLAVAIDKQGSLWYSTSDGLFRRTVTESGTAANEKQLVGSPFGKRSIISLFADPAGYIWAGLYGEGVLRIEPGTGRFVHLRNELNDGNVLNISGKNNVVWLATLGGATEIKVSGEQLKIKNYSVRDGLISDFIYQVFVDSKNRAWFATDGKGVVMKDETGFHHFEGGLNSKVVFGFAEDGTNQVWANIQGESPYRLDGAAFQPLPANLLRSN